MSPRSTTRPLYFWNWGSNSAVLRWQMSISVAKWTFFLSLCASRITSFLLLTFSSLRACLELFPSFIHCSFCIWNIHCLKHRNEIVNQIGMGHRSKPFACNVVFMISRLRRFNSLPCGFVKFQHTTILRFWNLVGCIKPRCGYLSAGRAGRTLCSLFARHSRVHMHFQLSPRIPNDFFVFFILWINKVDASHSSSIFEFWLLVFPFLFFSLLSGFPGDHIYPFGEGGEGGGGGKRKEEGGGFSFNKVNFVNPFQESKKNVDSRPHSNNHQCAFLASHPDLYE